MNAETLWKENRSIALACRDHPFVKGIENGSLSKERFRVYLAQDAFFLRTFRKAYLLAAEKAERDADRKAFVELAGGVEKELRLHREYSGKLGVDLERVEPLPACKAYCDFLLETAEHGSVAEILAAMTPCVRLYAWLRKEMEKTQEDEHAFSSWIREYASDAIEALARKLEAMLDAAEMTQGMRKNYRRAMELEYAFFDAP